MKRKNKFHRCRYKIRALDPQQRQEGHGSAYNSFRADEDLRASETTPLVRFPEPRQSIRSLWSAITFGLLLMLLLLGIFISGYLLYLQAQERNVLPPVDTPMQLISRQQWFRADVPIARGTDMATEPSEHIVVVQTSTTTCYDVAACSELLTNMQARSEEPLPYNFFVSSNGATFEGLGWNERSTMFPKLSAMVVAFIGNFTKDTPTTSQLEEAFTLFDASNMKGYLTRDFTIVGKVVKTGQIPTYLFASLQNLTQWDQTLSDDY